MAIIAVLLGPAASAAFGAGWRVSLFTTVALACAAANIVAYRPGRPGAHVTAVDPGQLLDRTGGRSSAAGRSSRCSRRPCAGASTRAW